MADFTPTGFTTDPYAGPPGQTTNLDVPSSAMDLFDPARLSQDTNSYLDRHSYLQMNDGVTVKVGQGMPAGKGVAPNFTVAKVLQPDEAKTKFGIPGHLDFTNPIPEDAARSLNSETQDYLKRQEIAMREPAGVWSGAKVFGVNILSSALDPLNVAAALVPGLGEERYASLLARAGTSVLGRTAIKAGVGAAGATLGNIPLVALQYGLSQEDQQDYHMADALRDLAVGGAFGALLHGSLGAVGDLWHGMPDPILRTIQEAPAPVNEAALRTAISQLAEGRPVTASLIFEAHQARMLDRAPVIDTAEVGRLAEEAQLNERANQLTETLKTLPQGDPRAADILARLKAIDDYLQNDLVVGGARKAALARRDELLTDTNPEKLQAAAAPLEQRRQADASLTATQARLAEITAERAKAQADVALSLPPKMQQGPSIALPEAMRYAAGDKTPEAVSLSNYADEAAKIKAPDESVAELPPELADILKAHQASFDQAAEAGHVSAADLAEVENAKAGAADASAYGKAIQAAGVCLARSI